MKTAPHFPSAAEPLLTKARAADEGRDERTPEKANESWLVLLASLLAQPPTEPVPLPRAAEEAKAEPSAPSRAPSLSPGSPHEARGGLQHGAHAQPGSGAASVVSTTLDAGTLGQLQVTISRRQRDLEIVIIVAEARVKALIDAEQNILLQQLSRAGLTARCSILVRSGVGTPFATQPRAELASRYNLRNRQTPFARPSEDTDGEEPLDESLNLTA